MQICGKRTEEVGKQLMQRPKMYMRLSMFKGKLKTSCLGPYVHCKYFCYYSA